MAVPQRPDAAPRERAPGARFLIVEARFYDAIGEALLAGAVAAFDAAEAGHDVVSVPGALEIPVAAAIALDGAAARGAPYAGVVALGCVVRGETYHFEVVSNESARGFMELGVSRRLPTGNGVLTVETLDQAMERADPARGDKGGEAARAALALHRIRRAAGLA